MPRTALPEIVSSAEEYGTIRDGPLKGLAFTRFQIRAKTNCHMDISPEYQSLDV